MKVQHEKRRKNLCLITRENNHQLFVTRDNVLFLSGSLLIVDEGLESGEKNNVIYACSNYHIES